MASNYPAGFYFKLSFKGEDAAFQAASGMSKEFGIEEVTCGGENRFKYRLPTVVTSQNLVLKRALVTKNSSLVNWCTSWLDQGFANNVTAQSVWLSLLNADSSTLKMWAFHNVGIS